MASVSLNQVSCVFRHRRELVRAVENLSLDIADGEFVVLLGPSGCGKTTTLRMVAGLESPSEGAIRIDGEVVNRVSPKDRDVAMVFQSYALYPHMTVFKNLAFGLKMQRTPKAQIKQRVHEVARRLGIDGLLDRRPAALSGGEKQRVALGRAIVRKPRVFLFDEPLSNLDVSLRLRARTELRALHRELRVTVLHVTHDQEEAMTLGDRIAVLRDGRLQQYGPPQEIYRRPTNRFVAGFVGTPPMNLIPGELQRRDGRLCFSSGFGSLELPDSAIRQDESSSTRRVVLGIRPQHVSVDGDGAGNLAVIRGCTIRRVEPLGDCVNIHVVSSDGADWIARGLADFQMREGPIELRIGLAAAHFFADDDQGHRHE